MNFIIKSASHTHQGRVRNHNEDSVFTFVRDPEKGDPLGLLIVADGVGGQKAGDIASKFAVETVFEHMSWFIDRDEQEDTRPTASNPGLNANDQDKVLEKRLNIAIQAANNKIIAYARENPVQAGNMGTTFTGILFHGGKATIAHVGDSRAYRLRNGKLEQITDDHSFVGQMVRDGQLTEEAYYVHPRRNVITRALGQFEDVDIDMLTIPVELEDQYLVCSDGLWEMIRNPEIEQNLIDDEDLDLTAETLVQIANENGGSDNISVVIGKISIKE